MASALKKKMLSVMEAVHRVPKNGYNSFHKYHYAMETDVVNAFREALINNNLSVIPSITGYERQEVPTNKGTQFLSTVHLSYEVEDLDTGDKLVIPWVGEGSDSLDKALYKAVTGGQKYFVLKAFFVPTGDDPEDDGGQVQAQSKPAKKKAPPVLEMSLEDVKARDQFLDGIRTQAEKLGHTGEQIRENLVKWNCLVHVKEDPRRMTRQKAEIGCRKYGDLVASQSKRAVDEAAGLFGGQDG